MNTVESKLQELEKADELHRAVTMLAAPFEPGTPLIEELDLLRKRIKAAREAFRDYEKALDLTIEKGRDPEGGFNEGQLIKALNESFDNLDRAVEKSALPSVSPIGILSLLKNDDIAHATHKLLQDSKELQEMIYHDQFVYIRRGKTHFKASMWIVGSMGLAILLLVLCLSRFFYTWVFYPVRDLEQGVGRVAEGDFEHRIELHSGDEMEELAAAFNDMTGRLREMYRNLEHQVNERSRQLVRSERLASVGFLAAGVAHEINNPLHAIALCSEALEGRLGELVARQASGPTRKMSEYEVIYKHLKTI